MRPTTTLRDALSDPALLGHVLQGPSWLPWRVLLIAAMGEELTDNERPIFTKLTGRAREPLIRVTEFTSVVGRRGGKTSAMAAWATYQATCVDHSDVLARGENGVLLLVAQDTKIAKLLLDRIEANLQDSEILRQLIKGRTQDGIELTNNISIEVKPASFRRLRGPTYVGILADELAFWFTDSSYAHPDVEVLAAARPGLLTTGGPLIMASSPYAKMGVLWDTFKRHYGPDGSPSVLVAKGTTRDFNQTIPQAEIDRELERDRARNTAELLAEFRDDLEGYVAYEVVQSCVGSYFEMAPARSTSYYAFTDPSGGSDDSFSLSISHREHERVVIDCIREVKPPFSPEQVIIDFVSVLKSYRCHRVSGDRYGGAFPQEQFNKRGVRYEPSERNKSEIYRDFLPLLNSGRVILPRNDRLIRQLTSLERTTARGSGRDNIDHPTGQHDDVSNAVAGAAVLAAAGGGYNLALLAAATSWDDEPDAAASYVQLQAERRHRELMARYGAPVSLNPLPNEIEEMKSVLTKSQASELLTAASLLPLSSRDQFITAVDKRLRSVKRPLTDADVSSAIVSTVTTTSHFMCDAAPQ